MLQLKNIKKDYKTAGSTVHALKGVSLRFRRNEFVSILGQSGCGKTTLLNIIGGLDHYTSGDLVICGVSTKDYKDRDWDIYRNHRVGFVFQSYNLIPHQTVLGNVELALTIAGVSKAERRKRAKEALEKVGLGKELKKRPNQLSGGQMQRVAIARALVNNPEILLADEPTGALDTATSIQIMELIREISGERLVVMVTHNPEIAEQYSSRIVRLQDGRVVSDSNPYNGEEETRLVETSAPKNAAAVKTVVRTQIGCPHCGMEIQPKKNGTDYAYICPNCNGRFRVEKREKWYKRETIVQVEEPVGKTRGRAKKHRTKDGKRERSSMSFATSLGLSARNLGSKKGRTVLTSVAGSIGIISVCLVLALSNGFNSYILKTEEDMLSYYPLEIKETSLDMTAIMEGMSSRNDMPDLSEIGNRVYVNSFLTNIAQGMTVTNDLSPEYIEYLESMPEEWYESIVYDTGIDLSYNLFTEVKTEEYPDGVAMSLSELKNTYTTKLTEQEEKYAKLAPLVEYLGSIYGKMPGTTDVTAADYGEYVLSQYELVGDIGRFPEKANEAVLVVGTNNQVTDLTLAQLGFIDEEQFMSLFPQTGSGEIDSDEHELMIPFEQIIGKKFMLNYNDAVFTAVSDPTKGYLYDCESLRTSLETENADEGIALEITGVLRLKEGLNYGCLGTGLYFTEQAISEYQAVNMNSEIVQAIRKQEELTKALREINTGNMQELAQFMLENGQYFQPAAQQLFDSYIPYTVSMGTSTYTLYMLYGDTALRSVGGDDAPNGISIYTDTFEHKENILSHLDTWNDTHEKSEQVRYTDTVGMMMSMVSTMLNAITYVLVAFTAISLIVSSVMIGIITYVSVVERTKEIGVLRSLGARKKDIKNLFNAETFIIGLSSGLFGVAVTYLLSFAVNAILGSLTGITTLAALPIGAAAIMVCVSVALTLISGLIPAGAAAKKDPVIALRTE